MLFEKLDRNKKSKYALELQHHEDEFLKFRSLKLPETLVEVKKNPTQHHTGKIWRDFVCRQLKLETLKIDFFSLYFYEIQNQNDFNGSYFFSVSHRITQLLQASDVQMTDVNFCNWFLCLDLGGCLFGCPKSYLKKNPMNYERNAEELNIFGGKIRRRNCKRNNLFNWQHH